MRELKEKVEKMENGRVDRFTGEAWNDKSGVMEQENSKQGKYARQFKKTTREEFREGQNVRIAQTENTKEKSKIGDRFQRTGVVVKDCGNDS